MLGTYALSSGYYEAYYGRAQRVRTKIAEDFSRAFERFDFVVTPTSPTVAFKLGRTHRRPAGDVPVRLLHGADAAGRASRRSRSRRASRQPDGGGPELPVGFQIAGPAFSDSAMLDAAHALERAIGFRRDGNGAASEVRAGDDRRGVPRSGPGRARLVAAGDRLEAHQRRGDRRGPPPERAAARSVRSKGRPAADHHLPRAPHEPRRASRTTVLHEIGHYFGADEATVRGWGL